jgi:hypothetical protein
VFVDGAAAVVAALDSDRCGRVERYGQAKPEASVAVLGGVPVDELALDSAARARHPRERYEQRAVGIVQPRALQRATQHRQAVPNDHELAPASLPQRRRQHPQRRAQDEADQSDNEHRGILTDPAEAPPQPAFPNICTPQVSPLGQARLAQATATYREAIHTDFAARLQPTHLRMIKEVLDHIPHPPTPRRTR